MLKKHSLYQTRILLIHMLKAGHVASNFYSLTILLFETIINMCLKQESFVMNDMFLVTVDVVTAV
jgi:hypothetical protein